MGDLSLVRRDLDKEVNGAWFTYYVVPLAAGDPPPPATPENSIRLRIARWENPRYWTVRKELLEPLRNEEKLGAIPEEKWAEITREIVVRSILLGWEGMSEGGVEVPFSVDKSRALLGDPELSGLYQFVLRCSHGDAEYRKNANRELLGKS